MYLNDNEIAQNNTVYIDTAWGFQEVSGIRNFSDGPWVVCGKENGGFGISHMVLMESILYLDPKGQTSEEIDRIIKEANKKFDEKEVLK